MTTLSTYNTWIQQGRLQKVYHCHLEKYLLTTIPLPKWKMQHVNTYWLSAVNSNDGQHCIASMDSELEAFSRNPTSGSFAAIAFQLATFTKYLNEMFLSY